MILNYCTNEPIKCPKCGTSGNLKGHGSYKRNLIYPYTTIKITVDRLKCLGCETTHALIPEDAVPYRQYSIEIICAFCSDKLDGFSNSQIREKYNIGESTRWRLTILGLSDLSYYLKTYNSIDNINHKKGNLNVCHIAYDLVDKFFRKFCQHIRLNNPLTNKFYEEFTFP